MFALATNEITHHYFLEEGQPRFPDKGARMYWGDRLEGKGHKEACQPILSFIDDVKKDSKGELGRAELRKYPKERADPQFLPCAVLSFFVPKSTDQACARRRKGCRYAMAVGVVGGTCHE